MHFNQIHRDTKEKKKQYLNGPPVALNMHFYNLNINACSIIELLLGWEGGAMQFGLLVQ